MYLYYTNHHPNTSHGEIHHADAREEMSKMRETILDQGAGHRIFRRKYLAGYLPTLPPNAPHSPRDGGGQRRGPEDGALTRLIEKLHSHGFPWLGNEI